MAKAEKPNAKKPQRVPIVGKSASYFLSALNHTAPDSLDGIVRYGLRRNSLAASAITSWNGADFFSTSRNTSDRPKENELKPQSVRIAQTDLQASGAAFTPQRERDLRAMTESAGAEASLG